MVFNTVLQWFSQHTSTDKGTLTSDFTHVVLKPYRYSAPKLHHTCLRFLRSFSYINAEG